MTKSEKRHFKLSMAGYQAAGDRHYLRLFDAIDAQKIYDEKAIKKKFAADVYFNQLARVKIYLYQQILKGLRNYYADTLKDIQLNNYLTEIEILFNKELYTDCKERIKKAKAMALKYERLHQLLRLSQWEMVIADHVSDIAEVDTVKKMAMAEQQTVVNKYQEYAELWGLYMETLSMSLNTGQARNAAELSMGNELMNHPLLAKNLSTYVAENLRLTVLVHDAYRKGDAEVMYRVVKKTVQLSEAHPHLLQERLNSYFQNLGALAGLCISVNRSKEAEGLIKKLRVIEEEQQSKINFKFRMSVDTLEIDLLKKQGRFEDAVLLIPALIKKIKHSLGELEPLDEMLVYHCLFGAYFGNANYKNAQFYLQKIITSQHQELFKNFHDNARLFNLILQFEQKEFVHLGHVLRTTYRHLHKHKKVHATETVLIDFFRKASKLTSANKRLSALSDLKAELLPLSTQQFERNFFTDFPLIEWIDSKLQKKDLAEIMRERYVEAVELEE